MYAVDIFPTPLFSVIPGFLSSAKEGMSGIRREFKCWAFVTFKCVCVLNQDTQTPREFYDK